MPNLSIARLFPGRKQVAEQQGRYLAQVLNQQAKEKSGWQPGEPFVFRSLGSMASVGGNSAILSLEVH